jgi:hypothetical protein
VLRHIAREAAFSLVFMPRSLCRVYSAERPSLICQLTAGQQALEAIRCYLGHGGSASLKHEVSKEQQRVTHVMLMYIVMHSLEPVVTARNNNLPGAIAKPGSVQFGRFGESPVL